MSKDELAQCQAFFEKLAKYIKILKLKKLEEWLLDELTMIVIKEIKLEQKRQKQRK